LSGAHFCATEISAIRVKAQKMMAGGKRAAANGRRCESNWFHQNTKHQAFDNSRELTHRI